MAKRISLSRAARLVGVKRGTLQQQIRAGELKTFEGQIVLADLLQAYPNAQIEDSSMLDRVEQIIEQATFVNADAIQRKPDKIALSARIMSLSGELAKQKRINARYAEFIEALRAELARLTAETGGLAELARWVDNASNGITEDDATMDRPIANELFLRVMSAQATVIPSGHEFFVEGAESILEAGLRGGLALNYGCSNGNCGLCKLRVVSGETRKIRHHDYTLSDAEKGLGYVLGCCNTAITDVVIEADEAQGTGDIPRQNIPIRIKRIDRPSDDVLIVSTRTPRTNRLRFLAGQGATLSIDQVGSSFYPIASCPCDDMNLQFHIGIEATDPVATYLADAAKTNDQLNLDGPVGNFVLNENSSHSLVFVTHGIGFATIKGLIEHAMALDVAENIVLLWIAERDGSHYLNNLCRAWNDALDNFDYVPLEDGDDIAAVLRERLQAKGPGYFDYYVCGAAPLRDAVATYLDAEGIPDTRLTFQAVDVERAA